jgi:hypothetical protein
VFRQARPKVHLKFPRLRINIRIPSIVRAIRIYQILGIACSRILLLCRSQRVEQALDRPRRLRKESVVWLSRLDPRADGDFRNENAEVLYHLRAGELVRIGIYRT